MSSEFPQRGAATIVYAVVTHDGGYVQRFADLTSAHINANHLNKVQAAIRYRVVSIRTTFENDADWSNEWL